MTNKVGRVLYQVLLFAKKCRDVMEQMGFINLDRQL